MLFRPIRGGGWHAEEAIPAEETIGKLREADVLIGQGKKVVEVVKDLGVTGVTCYRWRRDNYGL
jgi:catabolite regulation protein CreA